MIHILHHDLSLVLLSILIAVLGSYTALHLAGRARSAAGWGWLGWIGAAATAMGGSIWSMHFIAMLAFSLPGVPIAYDVTATAASLVVAMLATGLGFVLVGRSRARFAAIAVSGAFMGLGIVAMHYTGMAALRMPAKLTYDPVLVTVSVAIAVGAAVAALHLAFRGHPRESLLAAIAMGLAVAGMHYTAMAAAIFSPTELGASAAAAGLERTALAIAVAATTLVILLLGLVASVVERRLAEREASALRDSESRFSVLYSRTPLPLMSLDEEGRLSQVSDAWLDLVGYARADVIGRSPAHFMDADSARSWDASWPGLLAADAAHEAEYRLVTRTGAIVDVLLTARVERDAGGRLVRALGGLVDITARKRAEEALRHAQKMEALGKLTGGVAHDFNNLLQIISGNAEIARSFGLSERQDKVIDSILRAAARGEGLTRQLLAFSRRTPLTTAVVDLGARLPKVAEILRGLLREDIVLAMRVEDALWPVDIDPGEFELALINIAMNARDAMPTGGRLDITARNVTLSGPGEPRGEAVAIAFADTGIGIPRAALLRVFEPFFTTKPVDKGTGLGLSQVYGFAKQSGGAVTADSVEGQGTTITLYLPRATKAAAPSPTPDRADERRSGRRILLVEDSPEVQETTSGLLGIAGHRVTSVGSARAALEAFQAGAAPAFDLVLSDVVMPGGLNGVELAREIRRRHPGLAIILMSGYNEAIDTLKGEFPILRKPFSLAQLNDALAGALGASRPQPALDRAEAG